MIVAEIVANPVYLALLLLLLGIQFCHAWRVARSAVNYLPAGREESLQFNALLFLAVAFAGSNLLCVIITTPPLGRFTDAAGVFLPAVPAWVAVSRLRSWLRETGWA